MRPNLDEIRSVIFDLSEKIIQKFSEDNKGKIFYAFGIDLNAEYGDILLCANTKESYEKLSQESDSMWNGVDIEKTKWSYGDWEYQGFNLNYSDWDDAWQPYVSKIQAYLHDPNLCSDEDYELFLADFIKACTLVLLDFEKKGVLNHLDQEGEFYLSIADHDETEDESEARYSKIRKEYSV